MTRLFGIAGIALLVLTTSGVASASVPCPGQVCNGGVVNGGAPNVPEPGTTVLTAMALAAGAAGILRARRKR